MREREKSQQFNNIVTINKFRHIDTPAYDMYKSSIKQSNDLEHKLLTFLQDGEDSEE